MIDKISEFDKFLQSIEKEEDIPSIKRVVEKRPFSDIIIKRTEKAPIEQIPKYLTHCIYSSLVGDKISGILSDQQFGGKWLTMQNGVTQVNPKYTFLSPIPQYSYCLVFKSKNLINKNSNNSIYPTYYCEDKFIDKKGKKFCTFFSNKGWRKVDASHFPESIWNEYHHPTYRVIDFYWREREWMMENPIKFDRKNDVELITTRRCDEDAMNEVLVPTMIKSRMNLNEINSFKNKVVQFQKDSKKVVTKNGSEEIAVIDHLKKCPDSFFPSEKITKVFLCQNKDRWASKKYYSDFSTISKKSKFEDKMEREKFNHCFILDKKGVRKEQYEKLKIFNFKYNLENFNNDELQDISWNFNKEWEIIS